MKQENSMSDFLMGWMLMLYFFSGILFLREKKSMCWDYNYCLRINWQEIQTSDHIYKKVNKKKMIFENGWVWH